MEILKHIAPASFGIIILIPATDANVHNASNMEKNKYNH